MSHVASLVEDTRPGPWASLKTVAGHVRGRQQAERLTRIIARDRASSAPVPARMTHGGGNGIVPRPADGQRRRRSVPVHTPRPSGLPCASPGFLSRSASTGESRALNPGAWDSEGSARIQEVLRMLPVDLLPALPTCAGRDFPQGPANVKRRDRAQSPLLCGGKRPSSCRRPARGAGGVSGRRLRAEGPGPHPALRCEDVGTQPAPAGAHAADSVSLQGR